MCSFKINKVNPFPPLTAPFTLILISNLLHLKINCLLIQVNSLAKGIARSVIYFFTKIA